MFDLKITCVIFNAIRNRNTNTTATIKVHVKMEKYVLFSLIIECESTSNLKAAVSFLRNVYIPFKTKYLIQVSKLY